MTEIETREAHISTAESRIKFFVFVLLTFVAYLGLDILTPCLFDDPWPAIFLMILVVGQLTLICVWGTLVEGTFWFRLPWTLMLLVISWAALCVGVFINNGRISSAEIMGMGLVWFYGFAISYIPLKIAAWSFGWRIRLAENDNASKDSLQYGVRDIMIGTTILAVTLAIGRNLIPGEMPKWQDIILESGLNNPSMLTAFLIFSIVSLVVKLPCIWIALASDKSKILQQSIFWVICSGFLGLVELGILAAFIGNLGPMVGETLLALVAGHSAMAVTMIAVLFGLRCFGYHMTRTRPPIESSVPQVQN